MPPTKLAAACLLLPLVFLSQCALSERDQALGRAAADAASMSQAVPLCLDADNPAGARKLAASAAAISTGIQMATDPDAKPTLPPDVYAKAPEAAPGIAKQRVKDIEEAANPWWVDALLKIGDTLGLNSGLLGVLSSVGMALAGGGVGAAALAGVRAFTDRRGGIIENLVSGIQAARGALAPKQKEIVDQNLAAAQDTATAAEVRRVKKKLNLAPVPATPAPKQKPS